MTDGISPYSGTGSTQKSGGSNINAVYEDESKKGVTIDNFLNLMIAQLQNQDPMNPMQDTEYVTQLAQFATMQQMQELAYYSRSNFIMSLVGKDVTVARNKVGGGLETVTGPVQKISLVNNEYLIYVDGKTFGLNQIMEIHPPASKDNTGDDGVITDYGLSLVATTETSASFAWDVPTSEENVDAERLRYSVYYTTNPDMDTVEEVKKNGKLYGEAERYSISEETINGLAPGATYYVNILVKDPSGKESVYKKQVVLMPGKSEAEE